jgi:hypothetical protein
MSSETWDGSACRSLKLRGDLIGRAEQTIFELFLLTTAGDQHRRRGEPRLCSGWSEAALGIKFAFVL